MTAFVTQQLMGELCNMCFMFQVLMLLMFHQKWCLGAWCFDKGSSLYLYVLFKVVSFLQLNGILYGLHTDSM